MEKLFHFLSSYKTPVSIFLIILLSFILSRLLRWTLDKGINEMSGRMNIDPTRYKFIKNALDFVIAFSAMILIIYTIPQLKTLALTLFAGAGVLLAIAGFAAQQSFSNVINGVFIVVSKPFRVGDMVKIGEREYGIVEDITLRHTVVRDFKNKSIMIPNSIVAAETIINDTIDDPRICRWVEFGISYDSNIEKAIGIIQDVAANHPMCVDNRDKKEKKSGLHKVIVRLVGFGDSSVILRAYVWTDDAVNSIQMHSDINMAVKLRFDAEGVEIPFPYRTVVFKKDLPPNS